MDTENITVEIIERQLKEIAKELDTPLRDPQVLLAWGKRGGWYNDDIFVNLIAPLYFPSPLFKLIVNEDGQHAAIEN